MERFCLAGAVRALIAIKDFTPFPGILAAKENGYVHRECRRVRPLRSSAARNGAAGADLRRAEDLVGSGRPRALADGGLPHLSALSADRHQHLLERPLRLA